jgi:hypothetical protein
MKKQLTDNQQSVLNEITTGKCINRSVDGFKANQRTIDSLESRGLIFYGKYPINGPIEDIGWQATETGKTLNAFLNKD